MPKITEIYAFIAEDKGPEDEGLAAFLSGMNWMPMVGGDMNRIESLRAMAQHLANYSKKPIRLCKFTQRAEIEVIKPEEEKDDD